MRRWVVPGSGASWGRRLKATRGPVDVGFAADHAVIQPTIDDYRVLVADLLRLRQESLAPVVAVLRDERLQLERMLEDLKRTTEELYHIREDVRRCIEATMVRSESLGSGEAPAAAPTAASPTR